MSPSACERPPGQELGTVLGIPINVVTHLGVLADLARSAGLRRSGAWVTNDIDPSGRKAGENGGSGWAGARSGSCSEIPRQLRARSLKAGLRVAPRGSPPPPRLRRAGRRAGNGAGRCFLHGVTRCFLT